MSLTTASRNAIIIAAVVALSICHCSSVSAQSLFNNRSSSTGSQASATAATSLFGNIGFPQPVNNNATQGAGGSFVGRSNRGFVGSRASSQSLSSGGETGNSGARPTGLGSAAGARGDGFAGVRESTAPSTDGQREASSGVRRTRIIPRQRIAFEFPAQSSTAIAGQLTKQLANLAARYPDFAHIEVLAEPNGVVKLHGHVPSDDTRKLAALIVGLEPGVRGVQNELMVASDPD